MPVVGGGAVGPCAESHDTVYLRASPKCVLSEVRAHVPTAVAVVSFTFVTLPCGTHCLDALEPWMLGPQMHPRRPCGGTVWTALFPSNLVL